MFFSSAQPSRGFNSNRHEEQTEINHVNEPMFEKLLTPSDVGKLNRLVIPKQHAEKYFPLGGDSSDRGLLLSFEDELGKCWRFRYSYWNSSQSYVLTKGWSRYVKEKQLDAGDIILFQRHRSDGDRFFIGCRRRGAGAADRCGGVGEAGCSRGLYQGQGHAANLPYQPNYVNAGRFVENEGAAAGNPRRLVRLFGVNLECQVDESTPENSSSMSSQQGPTAHGSASYSSNYMDINQMTHHRDNT